MNEYDIRNKLVSVFAEHLPELEQDEALRYELLPSNLLNNDDDPAVSQSQQLEILSDLEKQIATAYRLYLQLHPLVQGSLEIGAQRNKELCDTATRTQFQVLDAIDEDPDKPEKNSPDTSKWTPYFETAPLGKTLQALAEMATGRMAIDGQTFACAAEASNAFKGASTTVNALPEISTQAKTADTMRRVFLVNRLMRFWKKAGMIPPQKTDAGEFLNFVADVIAALELGWDPASTVNSWYNRRVMMDSWG